jgi:hypothetical protein
VLFEDEPPTEIDEIAVFPLGNRRRSGFQEFRHG